MPLISDLPGINTIKVGRFYLKPSSIYETLTRCCRMVLYEADDRSFPLGRSGSATLIRFGNKNYVVTTRHELRIPRGTIPSTEILETIRISSGTSQLANVPIGSCLYETANPDQEYHDILIFEALKEQSSDQPYFYPLAPFAHAVRIKSFLVGYPMIDGVMNEYLESFYSDEAGEIHIKRVIGDCDIDHTFVTSAEYFKRYRHPKDRPLVDGYSGGAIFSLIGDVEHDNVEIVLDGIVMRGGAQYVHIIDVDYLVTAISEHRRLSQK